MFLNIFNWHKVSLIFFIIIQVSKSKTCFRNPWIFMSKTNLVHLIFLSYSIQDRFWKNGKTCVCYKHYIPLLHLGWIMNTLWSIYGPSMVEIMQFPGYTKHVYTQKEGVGAAECSPLSFFPVFHLSLCLRFVCCLCSLYWQIPNIVWEQGARIVIPLVSNT